MRNCGVLMHISSLSNPYGIGTLGAEAYSFVDFLKKAGQTYWQILPIGPTGYGDSPYQSYSAFAGNPLLIDPDMLVSDGLISEDDSDLHLLSVKDEFTSYESLFAFKKLLLSKAYAKFHTSASSRSKYDFSDFCSKNASWLDDYALFMSLKESYHYEMWLDWADCYRLRDKATLEEYSSHHKADIECWKFIQYKFFRQYNALKSYANKQGILIYGDMPIYVSMDSADIWANPKLFMLDSDCRPTKVAGCPPDVFSPTGQLWGNPLYNWDEMEKIGYSWWIERVRYSSTLFDLTRIDHFRGFDSFYAIPAENSDAVNGEWLEGPGMKLFGAINKALGSVSLVAEDLGFLTDSVKQLLKDAGYPGMNVLEFAFGGDDSGYLPHNHSKNSVVYIGTHDNQTAMGWLNTMDSHEKARIRQYLGLKKHCSDEKIVKGLIRAAYASHSDTAVIQAQDILLLDDSARMNIPSTIGNGNWMWRAEKGAFTDKHAKKLRKLAQTYYRLPAEKKKGKPVKISLAKKSVGETKEESVVDI
ncbi:MAG: 4-alpha-glucanotransferase [Oscillospiraceae bacterium]|nr:4-alpha-glucanotransferase [Oscillospiraceae bacterium]